jgi:hypothetical protein
MIRLQEPELRPTEDQSAWQATWNDDEKLLAHTPPGYWISLIEIAQIKRTLLSEMPADLRLRFLNCLHERVHGPITLEAMQRIEPACDVAMKMLNEMRILNSNDRHKLLMRWNVMSSFVALNPSIMTAIRMISRPN